MSQTRWLFCVSKIGIIIKHADNNNKYFYLFLKGFFR